MDHSRKFPAFSTSKLDRRRSHESDDHPQPQALYISPHGNIQNRDN
jgi:hypothetical protein